MCFILSLIGYFSGLLLHVSVSAGSLWGWLISVATALQPCFLLQLWDSGYTVFFRVNLGGQQSINYHLFSMVCLFFFFEVGLKDSSTVSGGRSPVETLGWWSVVTQQLWTWFLWMNSLIKYHLLLVMECPDLLDFLDWYILDFFDWNLTVYSFFLPCYFLCWKSLCLPILPFIENLLCARPVQETGKKKLMTVLRLRGYQCYMQSSRLINAMIVYVCV